MDRWCFRGGGGFPLNITSSVSKPMRSYNELNYCAMISEIKFSFLYLTIVHQELCPIAAARLISVTAGSSRLNMETSTANVLNSQFFSSAAIMESMP